MWTKLQQDQIPMHMKQNTSGVRQNKQELMELNHNVSIWFIGILIDLMHIL